MKKPSLPFGGIVLIFALMLLSACQSAAQPSATKASSASPSSGLKVLAVETFLADIAQNVAGERANVETLMPAGLDPHAFEPTPQDVVKIAASQVLIQNGRGLEDWLAKVLDNAGGQRLVIDASAGLAVRTPQADEIVGADGQDQQGDPHYWLDPISVIHYVENIRDGLTQADPQGKEIYARNATAYIAKLKDLDAWVRQQVEQIPPAQRQLVTNHESFGYYADRYGFRISGTIIASVSSSASPSARQLAALIDHIRQTGARAIFLETGANPQLADQIAADTGVKVITGLYTHSISPAGGEAPTYIDMIKVNTTLIVNALK
jgi:ABC-type Zn uptake system ZnuABC Zn-binding protein ZnuA